MDVDAATQTMIDNIPAKTGRPLDEWFLVLESSGAQKHGELMAVLKTGHGMTHGFANLIAARFRERGSAPASGNDLVDAQYAGAKSALRPIYERILEEATKLGADVEVSPKKTGVSLRRAKQFAVIEAPSSKRIQLGINLGTIAPTDRLLAAGGMCTHRIDLTAPEQVDDEFVGWLRGAYELAGGR